MKKWMIYGSIAIIVLLVLGKCAGGGDGEKTDESEEKQPRKEMVSPKDAVLKGDAREITIALQDGKIKEGDIVTVWGKCENGTSTLMELPDEKIKNHLKEFNFSTALSKAKKHRYYFTVEFDDRLNDEILKNKSKYSFEYNEDIIEVTGRISGNIDKEEKEFNNKMFGNSSYNLYRTKIVDAILN